MVYAYTGILFNLKKKGNSDSCYNMDEFWGLYTKWDEPDIKGQILCHSTYMKSLK